MGESIVCECCVVCMCCAVGIRLVARRHTMMIVTRIWQQPHRHTIIITHLVIVVVAVAVMRLLSVSLVSLVVIAVARRLYVACRVCWVVCCNNVCGCGCTAYIGVMCCILWCGAGGGIYSV